MLQNGRMSTSLQVQVTQGNQKMGVHPAEGPSSELTPAQTLTAPEVSPEALMALMNMYSGLPIGGGGQRGDLKSITEGLMHRSSIILKMPSGTICP